MANKPERKLTRALEDLILDHRQDIEQGKWNKVTFAEFAQRKLGCPITQHNIKGASEALEVQFNGITTHHYNNKQLQAAVRILAAEIVRLHGEYGTTCSPEVLALSNIVEQS